MSKTKAVTLQNDCQVPLIFRRHTLTLLVVLVLTLSFTVPHTLESLLLLRH